MTYGFTILDSGEVALILDVPGLMKQVMGSADNQTGRTSLVQI